MNIAIHGQGAADFSILVHALDGDGHIVDNTESLAMIGKGMMKPSAYIDGHAALQGKIRRQNGTTCGQPESRDQFRRIRNFQLHLFHRRKGPGLQLMHIFRRMHQQDILVAGAWGHHKIRRFGQSGFEKMLVDEPVFFRRKHMRANGQVIVVAVDQLEWKHDRPD